MSGRDELVNRLAKAAIYRGRWHDEDDDEEDRVKVAIEAKIAAELAERVEER
jgi:hypothetical protein